jgi:phosphatidylserine/phosphatidylglycerophosphate/cardiolipin synthase-like enzyme
MQAGGALPQGTHVRDDRNDKRTHRFDVSRAAFDGENKPGSVDSVDRSGFDDPQRVFEWNGSMLHAKAAVADSVWARVGSSNLNIASWIGNCELDVAVEDMDFARQMEDMYVADLEKATELVLNSRSRTRSAGPRAAGASRWIWERRTRHNGNAADWKCRRHRPHR